MPNVSCLVNAVLDSGQKDSFGRHRRRLVWGMHQGEFEGQAPLGYDSIRKDPARQTFSWKRSAPERIEASQVWRLG